MAVKIRLSRTGSRNQPSFRVVVVDSKAKRDGKNIEVIGHIDPKIKPEKIVVDGQRYQHWLKLGAKPTETVRKLIK